MVTYTFLEDPQPEEISQIADLYRAEGWLGVRGNADPQTLARLVAGSHCFLTARQDGRIIGMGRAISDGVSDAYIQDVTVEKSHRGQGIGMEMIRQIVGRLQVDGLGWIGLIASGDAHPFYERLGFRPMPASMPMIFQG